jgi:AcrR family transcriptional regulator
MPRTVDKEQKRKDILKAALKAYANKGIQNTTVQDIADIADIGKATIYLYFDSKENILQECFNEFAVNSQKNIEPIIDLQKHFEPNKENLSSSPLYNIIDNLINVALNEPEKVYLSLLNFFNLIDVHEEGIEGIKNAYSKLSEPIIDYGKILIKKYKEAGIIREDVNEDKFIYTLSFVLMGFFFRSIMVDDRKIRLMGDSLKDIISNLLKEAGAEE